MDAPVDAQDTSANEARPRAVVHPVVFGVSASLVLLISAFGVLLPDVAASVFNAVQAWIIETFGWFYMLSVAIFLVFALYVAMSRFGEIRLGPDDCEPDYSRLSWFAMLFSAGVGIGLMFFGVSEPVLHYAHPPVDSIEPESALAARTAMNATFLHWGVHAWAIYIVVGLSLAYFAYRHDLPLTLRSSLYPLMGERIHGPVGNAVDIAAVIGTVFGVATSLGFGVTQINAGLGYLFGVPESPMVQVLLIGGITMLATASVVAGLDSGIKRLSEMNMLLAVTLLLFMFVVGPTAFLMGAYLQNIGAYLADLVDLTFRQFAYQQTDWLGAWTLFYWAWWIAWAPFVGMFIARISRGRTIREFVFGVMAVPTLFIFFWMTVFGDTAIHTIQAGGMRDVLRLVSEDMPLALFVMLENFPISAVTSFLSVILIVTFFVTSSDSGSLVVDMIASGGAEDPPVWQRVFWAITQGLIAAVLLLAGGLGALQTAALTSGLPLSIVMLAMCVGLHTALQREDQQRARYQGRPSPVARASVDWRTRLAQLVGHHDRRTVERYFADVAAPAFASVVEELSGHDQVAHLLEEEDGLLIQVMEPAGEVVAFEFGIRLRSYRTLTFGLVETAAEERRRRHWYAEAWCTTTDDRLDVLGLGRDALIDEVLASYSRWVNARTEPLEAPIAPAA